MYSSKQLADYRDSIIAFTDKILELDAITEKSQQGPALWYSPKRGQQKEVENLRVELIRLSGPAAKAFDVSKRPQYAVRDPRGSITIHPILNWHYMLDFYQSSLDISDTLSSCYAAEAELRDMENQAKSRERSIPWKISRVISIPNRVRDYAGYRPGTAKSKVTVFSVGFGMIAGTGGMLAFLVDIVNNILELL